jgi:hypothetical protein
MLSVIYDECHMPLMLSVIILSIVILSVVGECRYAQCLGANLMT